MNRLVLIGNGFDLAHGLKTSYADFIDWYKAYRLQQLSQIHNNISKEPLLTIRLKGRQAFSIYIQGLVWDNPKASLVDMFDYIVGEDQHVEAIPTPFYDRLIKSIETKGWVDIENEYYQLLKEYSINKPSDEHLQQLNEQLQYLQELLIKYLTEITQQEIGVHGEIKHAIYEPIKTEDIAVEGKDAWESYVKTEIDKDERKLEYKASYYGISTSLKYDIQDYKKNPWEITSNRDYPELARLPQQIMFLNFNYTNTPEKYLNREVATIVPIHGELDKPESVIFGYGDEIDPSFKQLRDLNNGECLKNVKSMRYLETPSYHKVMSFIESAPFQVLIMGHSCGNSDRTLLNTIFEHKNCISIKPYFYQKEDGSNNYIELIQNISRNFNDMKLMRDRVVNKMQCEPLPQIKKQE